MCALVLYLKILACSLIVFLTEINAFADGAPVTTKEDIYRGVLRNGPLPFEDCGSRYEIVLLEISSCLQLPCQMRRGSTSNVKVVFNDDGHNTSFLKHQVRWIFNAIRTKATITPDPCNGDQQCITNNSIGKSYWASVVVNASLPILRGYMLWEALDQYDNVVICFKVPVYITL